MAAIQDHEREYIIWQNRAVDFYIGARALYLQDLSGPAAYCSVSAIELLLKASLVYFDRSFVPVDANHNIGKMLRILKNKGPKNTVFAIPEYFFFEQRYLSTSRYPGDKGLLVPATFLHELDRVIATLIVLVPFQFNSKLVSILSGRKDYKKKLNSLKRRNKQMKTLRSHLRQWIRDR
jgi:HEPN domain-containing protein